MHGFLKILYSLFYFKIPRFILKKFISNNNDALDIIAKRGHYKDRIYLAENIKTLNRENQLGLMKTLLDDNIEVVSKKTINQFSNDVPKELASLIKKKSAYWKRKRIENDILSQKTSELLKDSKNYKRKFGNGESFQMIKQMLKKPMNTGKWF